MHDHLAGMVYGFGICTQWTYRMDFCWPDFCTTIDSSTYILFGHLMAFRQLDGMCKWLCTFRDVISCIHWLFDILIGIRNWWRCFHFNWMSINLHTQQQKLHILWKIHAHCVAHTEKFTLEEKEKERERDNERSDGERQNEWKSENTYCCFAFSQKIRLKILLAVKMKWIL